MLTMADIVKEWELFYYGEVSLEEFMDKHFIAVYDKRLNFIGYTRKDKE